MTLKKHHTAVAVGIFIFLMAWALWTFYWVPRTAPQIDPKEAVPPTPGMERVN